MSINYSGPGIENQQYKKDIAVVDRKEKSYTVIDKLLIDLQGYLTIEYGLKNKKKLKNTKTWKQRWSVCRTVKKSCL